MPAIKDYSLLINKTFRHPNSGKYFKIRDIKADGSVVLSEVGDTLHIETLLSNWEQVNESSNTETLICG